MTKTTQNTPPCPECGGTMSSVGASHLQGSRWRGSVSLDLQSLRCDRMDPDPCDGGLEIVRSPERDAGTLFTMDGCPWALSLVRDGVVRDAAWSGLIDTRLTPDPTN